MVLAGLPHLCLPEFLLEFQTNPDAGIPARMANYRLRIYMRFPEKAVRQIVIYLKPTKSRLVYETSFEISGLRHEFEVIRLWEQPVAAFLQAPGLLPFAILSNNQEPLEVLQQVADQADAITERNVRGDVMAASAVLAGLVLDKDSIRQILRSDVMRESVIYQDILQEGLQESERRGLQKGEPTLVLKLLKRKFGIVPLEVQETIKSFSTAQLENLGESLLGFTSPEDLSSWLQQNQ